MIVWGLFTGPTWGHVGWGIAAILVGQILHAIDVAVVDRKLKGMAESAVQGLGPIPPRDVRKALLRRATAIGGDFENTFGQLCAEWSARVAGVERGAL